MPRPIDYEFWWEGENGMCSATVSARNLAEATRQLKSDNPDDHGADGFVTLEDGTERPINW